MIHTMAELIDPNIIITAKKSDPWAIIEAMIAAITKARTDIAMHIRIVNFVYFSSFRKYFFILSTSPVVCSHTKISRTYNDVPFPMSDYHVRQSLILACTSEWHSSQSATNSNKFSLPTCW